MPYPMPNTPKELWQYKLVPNLLGGVNIDIHAHDLNDNQTINLHNISIYRGKIQSESGYSLFGNTIYGTPQNTWEFERRLLTTDLILVTTQTVYKWNVDREDWIAVRGDYTTTTTSSYAGGATAIVVASATGFATGNLITVALDNGNKHHCTITVTGTTFALSSAIPADRTVANGAIVDKAVILNGSLDKRVVFETIPGNDWCVFTNGIDPPKRFDGTNCVVIPNLPSSGNTICQSLKLYNTALFLFCTVEGGTNYSQRVRRSNQTDPSDWTTGTAGFDDLLDGADSIISADVLGPYLIVYKERSIYRGSFYGSSGINYNFDKMLSAEGVMSGGSVIDMEDYHIVIGTSDVYEYRGDYSLKSISSGIKNKLYGYNSDVEAKYKQRMFAFYNQELNEAWVCYVSKTSADGNCDKILRYNITTGGWHTRELHNTICGFGSYTKTTSYAWEDLNGDWASQMWTWNTNQILTNAPITHLCAGDTPQVFSYNYVSTLDNTSLISYIIETKDFVLSDTEFRHDMIEMNIKGTGITLEYSTDSGDTWQILERINQVKEAKIQIYKQFVANKVRFRWTGRSDDLLLTWFGFSYKIESIQ